MIAMVDFDTLTIDELEDLRNECSRRILEMRQTKGLALPDLLHLLEEVKTTLQNQGKEWYSLERWQWMDGEVRFWLNPHDQSSYRTGWFSMDDLIAWSQDRGMIIIDDDFDDDLDDEPKTTTFGSQTKWRTHASDDNILNMHNGPLIFTS
ncbi:MAG: hypothetical protein GFH27_549281n277 [Chloroflexi bacterium AL-W]|nr:hypothetical protein [Chloroflexi bacterium AL-N1]NOK66162.1 hypothetical protein [Chloroflexi bacterium AL-N10]NOK73043.1 hypothetical protein [Chloroflexi bacterium AL-N5]NOK79940.1 hypothetical protein [Chloroflexi bacterium AL-W]NOK88204.1 hypothetical protein [Chloroflexi bacterium AL-N15]